MNYLGSSVSNACVDFKKSIGNSDILLARVSRIMDTTKFSITPKQSTIFHILFAGSVTIRNFLIIRHCILSLQTPTTAGANPNPPSRGTDNVFRFNFVGFKDLVKGFDYDPNSEVKSQSFLINNNRMHLDIFWNIATNAPFKVILHLCAFYGVVQEFKYVAVNDNEQKFQIRAGTQLAQYFIWFGRSLNRIDGYCKISGNNVSAVGDFKRSGLSKLSFLALGSGNQNPLLFEDINLMNISSNSFTSAITAQGEVGFSFLSVNHQNPSFQRMNTFKLNDNVIAGNYVAYTSEYSNGDFVFHLIDLQYVVLKDIKLFQFHRNSITYNVTAERKLSFAIFAFKALLRITSFSIVNTTIDANLTYATTTTAAAGGAFWLLLNLGTTIDCDVILFQNVMSNITMSGDGDAIGCGFLDFKNPIYHLDNPDTSKGIYESYGTVLIENSVADISVRTKEFVTTVCGAVIVGARFVQGSTNIAVTIRNTKMITTKLHCLTSYADTDKPCITTLFSSGNTAPHVMLGNDLVFEDNVMTVVSMKDVASKKVLVRLVDFQGQINNIDNVDLIPTQNSCIRVVSNELNVQEVSSSDVPEISLFNVDEGIDLSNSDLGDGGLIFPTSSSGADGKGIILFEKNKININYVSATKVSSYSRPQALITMLNVRQNFTFVTNLIVRDIEFVVKNFVSSSGAPGTIALCRFDSSAWIWQSTEKYPTPEGIYRRFSGVDNFTISNIKFNVGGGQSSSIHVQDDFRVLVVDFLLPFFRAPERFLPGGRYSSAYTGIRHSCRSIKIQHVDFQVHNVFIHNPKQIGRAIGVAVFIVSSRTEMQYVDEISFGDNISFLLKNCTSMGDHMKLKAAVMSSVKFGLSSKQTQPFSWIAISKFEMKNNISFVLENISVYQHTCYLFYTNQNVQCSTTASPPSDNAVSSGGGNNNNNIVIMNLHGGCSFIFENIKLLGNNIEDVSSSKSSTIVLVRFDNGVEEVRSKLWSIKNIIMNILDLRSASSSQPPVNLFIYKNLFATSTPQHPIAKFTVTDIDVSVVSDGKIGKKYFCNLVYFLGEISTSSSIRHQNAVASTASLNANYNPTYIFDNSSIDINYTFSNWKISWLTKTTSATPTISTASQEMMSKFIGVSTRQITGETASSQISFTNISVTVQIFGRYSTAVVFSQACAVGVKNINISNVTLDITAERLNDGHPITYVADKYVFGGRIAQLYPTSMFPLLSRQWVGKPIVNFFDNLLFVRRPMLESRQFQNFNHSVLDFLINTDTYPSATDPRRSGIIDPATETSEGRNATQYDVNFYRNKIDSSSSPLSSSSLSSSSSSWCTSENCYLLFFHKLSETALNINMNENECVSPTPCAVFAFDSNAFKKSNRLVMTKNRIISTGRLGLYKNADASSSSSSTTNLMNSDYSILKRPLNVNFFYNSTFVIGCNYFSYIRFIRPFRKYFSDIANIEMISPHNNNNEPDENNCVNGFFYSTSTSRSDKTRSDEITATRTTPSVTRPPTPTQKHTLTKTFNSFTETFSDPVHPTSSKTLQHSDSVSLIPTITTSLTKIFPKKSWPAPATPVEARATVALVGLSIGTVSGGGRIAAAANKITALQQIYSCGATNEYGAALPPPSLGSDANPLQIEISDDSLSTYRGAILSNTILLLGILLVYFLFVVGRMYLRKITLKQSILKNKFPGYIGVPQQVVAAPLAASATTMAGSFTRTKGDFALILLGFLVSAVIPLTWFGYVSWRAHSENLEISKIKYVTQEELDERKAEEEENKKNKKKEKKLRISTSDDDQDQDQDQEEDDEDQEEEEDDEQQQKKKKRKRKQQQQRQLLKLSQKQREARKEKEKAKEEEEEEKFKKSKQKIKEVVIESYSFSPLKKTKDGELELKTFASTEELVETVVIKRNPIYLFWNYISRPLYEWPTDTEFQKTSVPIFDSYTVVYFMFVEHAIFVTVAVAQGLSATCTSEGCCVASMTVAVLSAFTHSIFVVVLQVPYTTVGEKLVNTVVSLCTSILAFTVMLQFIRTKFFAVKDADESFIDILTNITFGFAVCGVIMAVLYGVVLPAARAIHKFFWKRKEKKRRKKLLKKRQQQQQEQQQEEEEYEEDEQNEDEDIEMLLEPNRNSNNGFEEDGEVPMLLYSPTNNDNNAARSTSKTRKNTNATSTTTKNKKERVRTSSSSSAKRKQKKKGEERSFTWEDIQQRDQERLNQQIPLRLTQLEKMMAKEKDTSATSSSSPETKLLHEALKTSVQKTKKKK